MFGQQQPWAPVGMGVQSPGMMGGNPWGQPAQEPTIYGNFLSPEQIREMQQNSTQFPVKLSREEYMRSVCTHKLRNPNRFMLELQHEDGQQRCALCGKSFQLLALDTPEEQIYGICKNMHDLIQSIKTYILDPPESLKDIYMMLGFIEKTPLLWKNAVKGFEHATKASGLTFQNTPQQNTYQMLGAILGGGMMPNMGMGYNPNPWGGPSVYGMAPQQPGYQPQPQQQGWGQPVTNPMVDSGYGFGQASGSAPVAPSAYGVQQPQPAYQPQMAPTTPPPGYGAPSSNPIGYVDPQSAGQPAPTQVTMSPMPATAPMPEAPVAPSAPAVAAPVNPNVQTPEKVAVAKTFTPAS